MSGTSLERTWPRLCALSLVMVKKQTHSWAFCNTALYRTLPKRSAKGFLSKTGRYRTPGSTARTHRPTARPNGGPNFTSMGHWPAKVDLIASHGQTMYHAPSFIHPNSGYANASLQIGDGDHIAMETGIITISDFRLKTLLQEVKEHPSLSMVIISFWRRKWKQGDAKYWRHCQFYLAAFNASMLSYPGFRPMWVPVIPWWMPMFKNTLFMPVMKMECWLLGLPLYKTCLTSWWIIHFLTVAFPKPLAPNCFNLHYLEKAIARVGGSYSHADIMATPQPIFGWGHLLPFKGVYLLTSRGWYMAVVVVCTIQYWWIICKRLFQLLSLDIQKPWVYRLMPGSRIICLVGQWMYCRRISGQSFVQRWHARYQHGQNQFTGLVCRLIIFAPCQLNLPSLLQVAVGT